MTLMLERMNISCANINFFYGNCLTNSTTSPTTNCNAKKAKKRKKREKEGKKRE